MKKLLAAILAVAMMLSLTAYGGPAADPAPESISEPESAAEAAPEPPPEPVSEPEPEAETVIGTVTEVSASMMMLQLEDGSELMFANAESIAQGLNGRKFQIGDKVIFGETGTGFRAQVTSITLTSASGSGSTSDNTSSGGSSKADEPLANAGDVYEAIDLINAEREKVGLEKLDIDSELMEMAAIRAEELSSVDYETVGSKHNRPDGRYFTLIFEDFGWVDYSKHSYGENADCSQATAEKTVARWMNSPGHKANILKSKVNRIGVGYCYNGDAPWRHYWVMLIAT